MKILIATDAFPPQCGGSGWSTFYLARALSQRGHDVEIAMPLRGARGVSTRIYQGLRVVQVGYEATNVPGLRAWQRAAALEQTFAPYLEARGREFDVIHAQHLLTIPASVRAKRRSGTPVVSTVRDYWPVCLYGTLWREGAICPICRGAELARCLAQKYGIVARALVPLVPLVARELERRRRALRASDAVIAVSQFVAETLREIVAPSQLHVVPNLVDVEAIRQATNNEQQITNNQPPFLLFVGKLNRLKGADWLEEILQKSRVALPLVVVGDGECARLLARVPRIELRGWLPNQGVLRLLARAEALLFPSRWAEPLARTLLEAQALGTPTVALNTGGTRDIITHDENGLLADNLEEFAQQLARLVGDAALRRRLKANAQRVAQEKFGAEIIVKKIECVYEQIAARRSDWRNP